MDQTALWVRNSVLVLLVCSSAYTDLRHQRILNVHTFPSMLLGLVLGALIGGWSGLGWSGLGLIAGLLSMGVLFAMNIMKAGDVKLAMAFGALFGPGPLLRSVVLSFILYLPVGLLYLTAHGQLLSMGTALKRMGRFLYTVFHPALVPEPLALEGMTLAPFGMVLGVAALLVHFWGWMSSRGLYPG